MDSDALRPCGSRVLEFCAVLGCRARARFLLAEGFPIIVQPAQEFGDNPVEVRETGHYTEEYVPSFVEKWDSLIDWEKRADSEGNFFIDLLRKWG